ncbi:MAG: DUF2189 domain-containing protein [Alphaproteobacteria bacterium]|nr:DUF2189 domain-containing protein [Alphaproteobacteria bacterium]
MTAPLADHPGIRSVPMDRPWTWLAAGWSDLVAARWVSVGYGAVIVAVSLGLIFGLVAVDHVALVLPLAAGFLLVAPALATGLYDVSRRLAAGEAVSLGGVLGAFRRNGTQLALMGLALIFIHLAWVRIATLLFALFAADPTPSWDRLVPELLLSAAGLPLLLAGTAVGAVLAAITFTVSVVSIPMLLDRQVSVALAVVTSVRVVWANPLAMALWAALIAVFTAAGLATLALGLAVVLPLVGHATWHAYRDLVE